MFNPKTCMSKAINKIISFEQGNINALLQKSKMLKLFLYF